MNPQPPNNADASPACKLLHRLASRLEAIDNLTFLTLREAEHPEKVRFYMGTAEEQMQAVRQIVLETHTDGN